jgi:hypothetical protein
VWHKKLEKQISSGVSMKDIGLRAEKQKQEQRLVRNKKGFPMMRGARGKP